MLNQKKMPPKPKELVVYVNGEWLPDSQAKISVMDHGLLYGDGVFEGMRSYGGKVFRMDEHLERLWNSAKAICLEIPVSPSARFSSSRKSSTKSNSPRS